MNTSTYDPAALLIVFKGLTITGFSDESVVKIARNETTWKLKSGTTGEQVRTRNRNRSGYVELSIMQSSPTNDFLSAILASDELLGDGLGACMVRDNLGTTLVEGDGCYLEGWPESEFTNDAKARVWRVIIPDMNMFVGGANT